MLYELVESILDGKNLIEKKKMAGNDDVTKQKTFEEFRLKECNDN